MRNLIIESIGRPIEVDFSKTSVAHARNSVILAHMIGADLITGDKDIHLTDGVKYDNIICSYASPYMKYKTLIQVVRDNPDAKLWWFVNDHDLEDNILLRNVLKETLGKRKINMICNNSRQGYRGWVLRKKIRDENRNILGLLDDFIVEWHTLNLNAMIYSYNIPYEWSHKTRNSIYYGTMRKWRLDDLIEYQHPTLTLSATPKAQKKFIDNGVTKCNFMDKLSWQRGHERLKNFKFSLYVEDIHTHDNYAHMANRFYEALMFNVVTLFDAKCINTINDSNFTIDEKYIVSDSESFNQRVIELGGQYEFEQCLIDNEAHKKIAKQEHVEITDYLTTLLK